MSTPKIPLFEAFLGDLRPILGKCPGVHFNDTLTRNAAILGPQKGLFRGLFGCSKRAVLGEPLKYPDSGVFRG